VVILVHLVAHWILILCCCIYYVKTSYFRQQAHHLDIALETDDSPKNAGGIYTYSNLVEIWQAANATKSHAIRYWWEPDAMASLFIGTSSDMANVQLPAVTHECMINRIDVIVSDAS
jgi:hypothetical protein